MNKWVRLAHGGGCAFGTLNEDGSVALHRGDMFDSPTPTGETVPAAFVVLRAPVRPGKFIGLWNNFHELATKQGNTIPTEPLTFLKSPGSIVGPEAPILPPPGYTGRVIYEGELAIVIGRRTTHADEAEAARNIFGYTCINDVTATDILTADPAFPQWARAKSPDSFGPVGPCIVPELPADAHVRVLLNGRERQNYPLSDMILPPARIVALLSREMTLEPGDLIACGTSVGALPMRPGMVVEVAIDGIGTLRNIFAPTEAPA
ncbi:MAG: fumarylacetoacetate hydrolase family protein [Alphaproteobacteria bacterium]|nr:fumarylacetoacetate hydrolase family protein [Alphaproteobacteria bacterium]